MGVKLSEDRLRRIEADERSRWGAALRPLTLLAFLVVGGLAGLNYLSNKEDKANGGAYLPPVLIHTPSLARQDLGLLTRSTYELAIDIKGKITAGSPDNREAYERFYQRLRQNHFIGRNLEPRLTREERLVLMAEQHAETFIEDFLTHSLSAATYEHQSLDLAIAQLQRAKALASGEPVQDPILARSKMLQTTNDALHVGLNVKAIKAARTNEQVPDDALYVPELGDRKSSRSSQQ